MKKWREIGSKVLFIMVVLMLIFIAIITAITLGPIGGLRGKIMTILSCVPLGAVLIIWIRQK